MEAKSKDQKTFQLFEQEKQLGELVYESIFSSKAEIRLPDSDCYKITPVGVFDTSIHITKDEVEIANLKMNWKGQIIFDFKDGKEYIFKAKGIFNNKYLIENEENETLIVLDPQFNWRKFNYNYEILYDKNPKDILFVLLSVYAANYTISLINGVVAATGGV